MEPLWHKDLPFRTIVYPDRVGLTCELTIQRTSLLHENVFVATVQDGADSRSILILRDTGFVVDMGCYAYLSQPPMKRQINQYTDKELGDRQYWIRRLGDQFTSLNRKLPSQLASEFHMLTTEMIDRTQRYNEGHA